MAGSPARHRNAFAVGVAFALVAASACDSGPDEARPERTTTTAAPAATCPVGGDVPPAVDATAPAPLPPAATEPVPAGPGLDLATLLPRTGDLAFLGAAPVAAAQLAVQDVDAAGGVLGAPITLRHGDSAEGTPGAAEAETDRLLAEGADAVIGPLSSSVAAAVLDRVATCGGVLVSPGAAATALDRLDGGGRLFRTVATEVLQGRALAGLVADDGVRSVDLVVRADGYGEAVAGGFTDAFEAAGGSVGRRLDHPPTLEATDLGPLAQGRPAGATVVVGLADSAPVLDALAEAGRPPAEHPTYGTDGNLGERLGDLVAERAGLACLRGLLATAPPDEELAERIAVELGADGRLVLDHAAETYDAVVAVALAAEAAGATDGASIAGALPAVTRGGTPCHSPADCLELARQGGDLVYVGRSGRLGLDDQGNRSAAELTLAAFDARGRLARLGGRSVP